MKTINVDKEIQRLTDLLQNEQSPNGSWSFPFETGVSTDAYMIILLRSLEINDEELIKELTQRILQRQSANGAWKLFYDEGEGNLTLTIEAYYSLLYSGYFSRDDSRLIKAKQFILKHGGLAHSHMFLKIMLAITGQIRWPKFFPIPIEFLLLPTRLPINFFSFSVFGRANLCPIMILANKKYSLQTKMSPDLSDLFLSKDEQNGSLLFDWTRSAEWRSINSFIKQGLESLMGVPEKMRQDAIKKAKQYMLERIEPDGTFLSYFSSTFLMIFALLSLDVSKNDPLIQKAIQGLIAMKTKINGQTHIQYTTASVWNTALISTALQEAGLSPNFPTVKKANEYLTSRQHTKFGDWQIHNPKTLPGGFGFSDVNTINPDVDDTTASLRAFARSVKAMRSTRLAWEKGVTWVSSMQNADGGWPSFERNGNQKWLKLLPLEKAEFLVADPSSADLTGRTLEFFGRYTKLSNEHPIIQNGVQALLLQQEKNGSWYGRWGICYIYGTWAALTGLKAVKVSSRHRSIRNAVNWLEGIQNSDGGWGESCRSDSEKMFVPLNASTITHTAWAVDALISTAKQPTEAIQTGIQYLAQHLENNDWTMSYPTGQGMAGGFYIHYHSYRYIFPLLALSHYRNKFN